MVVRVETLENEIFLLCIHIRLTVNLKIRRTSSTYFVIVFQLYSPCVIQRKLSYLVLQHHLFGLPAITVVKSIGSNIAIRKAV